MNFGGALLPLLCLCAAVAVIWWLGTGRFGRVQTQLWIYRFRRSPKVYSFLDKHHGKFRAATHYVEFGGLFLILYWLYDAWLGGSGWMFRAIPATIIAMICMAAALLDELHQLRSGTRQFRRVDFFHSCCGIALAALIVQYQQIARGV